MLLLFGLEASFQNDYFDFHRHSTTMTAKSTVTLVQPRMKTRCSALWFDGEESWDWSRCHHLSISRRKKSFEKSWKMTMHLETRTTLVANCSASCFARRSYHTASVRGYWVDSCQIEMPDSDRRKGFFFILMSIGKKSKKSKNKSRCKNLPFPNFEYFFLEKLSLSKTNLRLKHHVRRN